jgi:translation initiation factor IF-2
MRICELAKEIGIKSADIIDELKKHRITGKTASSSIDSGMIPVMRKKFAGRSASEPAKKKAQKAVKPSTAKAKKTEKETAPAEKKKAPKAKTAKKVTAAPAKVDIKAEEARKKAEEEQRKLEEKKQKAEEEARQKAEEELRKKAEEEARKKEEAELREIEKQIAEEEIRKKEEEAKQITIGESVTVKEFSEKLNLHVAEIIKSLFIKGTAVTVNQTLGVELATDLAKEMGYTVKVEAAAEPELGEKKEKKKDLSHLPVRPPVVTVMGHVDHGKTSLLDIIRKTDVASKEAGGITQHIGASSISTGKGSITFLDTPGHEAFTALRARGAQVTDIVVLVVAADDGVMPQTEEAINHSKAAGVAMIVAINKIDKPEANPDKVRQELTKFGLVPEEWGGDTIFCEVSAKSGQGLDHLLEMIQLQAEVLELHADPEVKATATVIESRLDKSRGPVHSMIVNEGTLRRGDSFVMGVHHGKVRAIVYENGRLMKDAGPSVPLELLGASALCASGDILTVVGNDRKARQISQERQSELREKRFATQKQHVRLDSVVESISEGETTDIKLVIKADAQGSVEAVIELLAKLRFEEVKLHVIHSGVGGITETDVMLAAASDAIVIGFNIRPTEKAKNLAVQEKIDIRFYNVIYEITDDIKSAMLGALKPKIVEKVLGHAEVREVFRISKVGNICGCMVLDGLMRRNSTCRLLRDNVVVHTGTVSSLRRFKEDVKEVANGYECGIGIERYNDIKPGDIIELFEEEEVAQTVLVP